MDDKRIVVTDAEATETAQKSKIQAFYEEIQTEKYRPYKTGLSFFDDMLMGGLMRQTVTLILAAPGAGKTALCAQIGEAIAENGRPVQYFNLEMSGEQMLARSISSRVTQAGTSMSALEVLQGYRWKDDQKKREAVKAALDEYEEKVNPWMQYNGQGLPATLEEIKKRLEEIGKAAKDAQREAPAVILDYLHLISADRMDEAQTIKATLKELKDYAVNFDTVAIAISATNRASNTSGNITEASGRDSSGIEYTGDNIISLNFYECELPTKEEGKVSPTDVRAMSKLKKRKCRRMTLRVLKGRFIAPGREKNVYFLAPASRFYDEGEFIPVVDGEKIPFVRTFDWDDEIEDDGREEKKTGKKGRKKKQIEDDDDII